MKKELTPYERPKQVAMELANPADFMNNLNQPPSKADVRVNKMANNSLYLSIAVIEAKLDYHYKGLWQVHSYQQQVIANEVTGSLILEVFHPAGVWLKRLGTASVLIQQSKGADITDISAKGKNTLVKDIPHLKAECIKNAAKSLGVAFGRNLNRDYDTGVEQENPISAIKADMQNLHSVEELLEYWKTNLSKNQRHDIEVKRAFNMRKTEIMEGGQDAE